MNNSQKIHNESREYGGWQLTLAPMQSVIFFKKELFLECIRQCWRASCQGGKLLSGFQRLPVGGFLGSLEGTLAVSSHALAYLYPREVLSGCPVTVDQLWPKAPQRTSELRREPQLYLLSWDLNPWTGTFHLLTNKFILSRLSVPLTRKYFSNFFLFLYNCPPYSYQ